MKIRSSFVSNSSSSSFLIVPLDRMDAYKIIGRSTIYLEDLLKELQNNKSGTIFTVESEINQTKEQLEVYEQKISINPLFEYYVKDLQYQLYVLSKFDPSERLIRYDYEWDSVNDRSYNWYESLIEEYFTLYSWNVDNEEYKDENPD